MPEIRPVIHILSLIAASLGVTMAFPMALDLVRGDANWAGFFEAMVVTILGASLTAIASHSHQKATLGLREAWLLTAGIWLVLPAVSALPFIFGEPDISFTDAYFESVSGFTTTGSTVITHLGDLPQSVLLWRGMLNWMGGLGIAFVAMIFLPVMRVGGMQLFRTEGFDTFGKILPRARDIAVSLLQVYAALTVLCAISFAICGQKAIDAIVHAMACVATGGFSNYDASFSEPSLRGASEYVGTIFMLLSAMPFIRFVQLMRGDARPIWHDLQVRAMLRWFGYASAVVILWRLVNSDAGFEHVLRTSLFNIASILTGTGFGSDNVSAWGSFPLMVAFTIGMIGGCSGSSSGAISVFRWQLFGAVLRAAIRRLYSPNRIAPAQYNGHTLTEDVVQPLMLYFTGYVLVSGISAEAISMTGVDFTSALFAVWTSIGNIGYGIGPLVNRTGTMVDFNDAATWIMSLNMLLGRLGLLAIFVILLPRFWRD
ncbi:TrkH family potassium uptake protein [Albirhodobacter sp. R86504]|jgi:trk system potassium uptake protein TrkH|uniref:TrkH family potassium uptake protein n=1 Tax=Albirhodobacter sp. R86504 TaxID=3093848 RepID=UPI00366B45B6